MHLERSGKVAQLRGLHYLRRSRWRRIAPVGDSNGTLAESEGRYAYRDGQWLDMVADGETLVAIISEGKYPLRRIGPTSSRTAVATPSQLLRDKAGHVIAFNEGANVLLPALLEASTVSMTGREGQRYERKNVL